MVASSLFSHLSFEHSLVQELRYNGYERLRRAFDRSFSGRPASSEHNNPATATTATTTTTTSTPLFDVVIDAGCGTGLVGEKFRNVSRYLIGVDLSEVILDEAQRVRPNLYNETLVGDVTQVFVEKKPISLIVAADSYIYFGDLEPLFHSMQKGLQEGGYAAFTLENVDADTLEVLSESKPNWRWQLTASGRFAHNRRYVEEIGKDHDLQLMHYEPLENFRYENGKGVGGHIFVVQKRSATDQEL
jgi:predicted TPR repeat methyltransferase